PSPPEAEVDLHVAANSNTYPDQSNGTAEPDNVIPMPYVRPNANDELEPGPSSPPAMAAVDLQPTPIDEPALRPAMENHANILLPSTQQEINVRITERTADFSVPVTDAELPQRIGQLVDDKTHSQLRLDFATDEQSRGIGDDPSVLQLESANFAVSRVDDQTDDTQQPTRTDDAIVAEPEMMDDAPIASEDRPDDAMLQVAKRFAARLPAE
ncbi:MAG: hypothetical protein OEM91_16990, partial [Hyphomicrobiales bacterium]|nr:hypothetical protein [Hyphomicrobiales bacterium]